MSLEHTRLRELVERGDVYGIQCWVDELIDKVRMEAAELPATQAPVPTREWLALELCRAYERGQGRPDVEMDLDYACVEPGFLRAADHALSLLTQHAHAAPVHYEREAARSPPSAANYLWLRTRAERAEAQLRLVHGALLDAAAATWAMCPSDEESWKPRLLALAADAVLSAPPQQPAEVDVVAWAAKLAAEAAKPEAPASQREMARELELLRRRVNSLQQARSQQETCELALRTFLHATKDALNIPSGNLIGTRVVEAAREALAFLNELEAPSAKEPA